MAGEVQLSLRSVSSDFPPVHPASPPLDVRLLLECWYLATHSEVGRGQFERISNSATALYNDRIASRAVTR